MADATEELAHWRLRLWEFELVIAPHGCIKQQTVDALSGIKTDDKNNTLSAVKSQSSSYLRKYLHVLQKRNQSSSNL